MHACPCCCDTCDDGYIRDAVWDEETNRAVWVDYGCDCRDRWKRKLCAKCTKANCVSYLPSNC
ncbi:hypothetical protein ACIBTP_38110 [Streptomyces avidinii]|uniref:hypothetical protein n=1 Tax=Streptomyces avidinii TaxID=1895 RepID=UPI0037A7F080